MAIGSCKPLKLNPSPVEKLARQVCTLSVVRVQILPI
jgi:hypothetical protein